MFAAIVVSLAFAWQRPSLLVPQGPWILRGQASGGYSHYRADDLNLTLQLLEKLTRESAGTNPYAVAGFDGHPAWQGRIGVRRAPWNLEIEVESWSEGFVQTEVPFNLDDNDRDNRITCDDLRAVEASLANLAGCIQAKEDFVFLPVTLQLGWMPDWTTWLRAGFGYGLGILGGSARVELAADYLGPDAADPDVVTFSVQPDPLINPVHKFFASVEFMPWSHFGLEARGGYRLTSLHSFVLRDKEGSSQVFDAAFDFPEEGDHLWIRSAAERPDTRLLWIGSEDEAKAASSRYSYHPVRGDFDGWFVALAVNVEWGL